MKLNASYIWKEADMKWFEKHLDEIVIGVTFFAGLAVGLML